MIEMWKSYAGITQRCNLINLDVEIQFVGNDDHFCVSTVSFVLGHSVIYFYHYLIEGLYMCIIALLCFTMATTPKLLD